jgi:cytochrome b subunit of formate dehydrogenase
MTVLFWVAGVLLVLLGVPSAIFFALHLATGEPVPLARARALFHWVVVVGLGTFDIAIFTKVVQGLIAIW